MEFQLNNIDPISFRAALRQWASGVTVVTCADRGFQHGMTVSSFLSVSLTPPLLLVSLQNGTRTLEMIKHAKTFAVNILHHEQKELADLFAGRRTIKEIVSQAWKHQRWKANLPSSMGAWHVLIATFNPCWKYLTIPW